MMRRLFDNASGSVALLFAIVSPVLILCVAMSVDIGTFYLQKRALQSATDLAAVAAAENPNQALTAAQQNISLNGFSASAVTSVQSGVFAANANTPAAQWFTAGTGSAVQVNTEIQAPFYFASILSLFSPTPPCSGANCSTAAPAPNGSATITATATANVDPEATFGIGSGLVTLNGGILNSLLGGLLGSGVSLSVMDYQALANANVDLFAFSNALATQVNATALNYNQLANLQVPASTVLSALASSAGAGVSNALTTLAQAAPQTTIQIGQLLSFGEFGSLQINSPEPISATADALDLVSAIAELANGQHQVQTSLTVGIAPIASATLALTVGERPVGSGFVTIGTTGASVHTAQTRLLLTLQIAQTGSTSLINLPLYIELGAATATASSISCPTDITQSSVTLNVTPAVVNAWIGTVSSSDMTNYSAEPTPSAAPLVTIPGLGAVSARANATISNLSSTSVSFSYSDITGAVRKTTSTTDYISSLLYNLFSNLQLSVNIAGLNVTVPSAVSSALGATLAAATAPIDQALSQLLSGLGLSLGNAYTWASGIKCGGAKLVL